MTALERLRALRISEKHPTEALPKLTKAFYARPSVSFGSGQVGSIPENTPPDAEHEAVLDTPAATLSGPRWLATVAEHLDTTPAALIAAGVILPEEVPHYRDPRAMADALRRAHPGRWPAREPDDRRHCRSCRQLAGARCRARRLLVMDDLPRRCTDYLPTPDDPDQRPGRDRWPDLLIPLEASP